MAEEEDVVLEDVVEADVVEKGEVVGEDVVLGEVVGVVDEDGAKTYASRWTAAEIDKVRHPCMHMRVTG